MNVVLYDSVRANMARKFVRRKNKNLPFLIVWLISFIIFRAESTDLAPYWKIIKLKIIFNTLSCSHRFICVFNAVFFKALIVRNGTGSNLYSTVINSTCSGL